MLEENDDRPTVFSASVGNLPPGKAVLLTITYVTELEFEDGKLMYLIWFYLLYSNLFSSSSSSSRYVLPTQPYAPNGRQPTPKFTRPFVKDLTERIPYGLQVDINVCLLLVVVFF